jgi:hypothetical protein
MHYEGSMPSALVTPPPRCAFPGCGEWGDHQHHITYDPPVIKWLCIGHHEQITILNGQQARKYRVPLSNRFRWRIWFQWTQGKMKVRRTQKALEWTEYWQRPVVQLEYPRTPEVPVIPASTEPIAEKNGRTKRKKATARKRVGAKAKAGKTRKKRARSPKKRT